VQRRVGSLRAQQAPAVASGGSARGGRGRHRYISYTYVNQFDTETILHELQPKYYVKGKDWQGRLPPDQVRICAEHGIEVVYLDTVVDSSSRILKSYLATEQQTQR